MITKYRFGNPISTDAVVKELPISDGLPDLGTFSFAEGFSLSFSLAAKDAVYGLGEANRGINKRGYHYVSCCSDDPNHTEEKTSLYGAHNFLMVTGSQCFGLFLDYPAELSFDIGYTRQDTVVITAAEADLDLYVISGTDALSIVHQFREMIGTSYLPPLWAFGFQQSRWGYQNEEDVRRVARGYRDNHLPIDTIVMDIDYMERYKDFTINEERFPSFPAFVEEMKEQDLHLVPIIDAGVKIEPGYDVYEAGVAGGHFCKRKDGTDFVAGVWPGNTHFPDVLNSNARAWFGSYYNRLTEQGIEGFWNDMNEPAIFYSEEGLKEAFEKVTALAAKKDHLDLSTFWDLTAVFNISNDKKDYTRFYHNMDGKLVRHDKVHNLYGFNMTRAAAEALRKANPEKRQLLYSRSSYTGMHRYAGIWTGDNQAWWSHLLLNVKMMPSLSMCGYLYSGADLSGFGSNTTRDLSLRWLAFGIFTPLMRNHSALGTREQEYYQFEDLEDFRAMLSLRYRLIPYIYSEFVKAALGNTLLFSPLAFAWPQDARACEIEDQILLGESLMLTPVCQANVTGRMVYLPEDMLFVKFTSDTSYTVTPLSAGDHYISCALNEVPVFVRKGHLLPLAPACESTRELRYDAFELLGETGAAYELYMDDGYTRSVELEGHLLSLKKEA